MNPWIGLLLSALGALIPALLLYPFFHWLYRKSLARHPTKKLVAILLSLSLGIYSLFCAYLCFSDYVGYAMEIVLPKGEALLLAAAFLLAAVWLSGVSKKGMDVFSLVCFAAVCGCVLLLFAFGMRHYRWEYLSSSVPKSMQGILHPIPTLLKDSLLPLLPLAAYFALTVPRRGGRMLVTGTTIGYAVLLLCILQTLLTFGAKYAAQPPYPYSFAVRVISIGPYFFRLEGFSYFTEYIACLVRTSICLALPARLLGRFSPRFGRFLPPVAATVIFLRYAFF